MAKRDGIPLQWVLTVMLGLSILMSVAGQGVARPAREMFQYVMIAPTDIGMYLATTFRRAFGDEGGQGLSAEQAEAINLRQRLLKNEVAYLRGRLADSEQRVRDLTNFQEMFGPAKSVNCVLIPARVVAGESLPYGDSRTVGVGERQGARAGDRVTTRRLVTDRAKAMVKLNVLGANALVGYLGDTGAFTAKLILVTDRNFHTPAFVDRDLANARMIPGPTKEVPLTGKNNELIPCTAVGDGWSGMVVRGISADKRVQVGDWLVTSIPKTVFLNKVPIGTVVEVRDDPQQAGFQELIIAPDADLAALRRVYIVYPLWREGAVERR
ncbi:hypothetical protein LCGC14_0284870 [marine sediment metagenome]|uniref:Cell shape-determining protein MreC n=1 Tax=marine sediment metagenome TaxID=412755 RepID=A0A0F9X0G1_9ZZZZ|nr:rod shape-determining protein MreC [Phycisphaerae bacterium]HDZ45020.1 rod shape-determining protein MreC [Phycisphaerae bacterium]